jgi:hypothetical protein
MVNTKGEGEKQMSVTILPYIDDNTTQALREAATNGSTTTIEDVKTSFQAYLENATRAQQAMAVDALIAATESGSVSAETVETVLGFNPLEAASAGTAATDAGATTTAAANGATTGIASTDATNGAAAGTASVDTANGTAAGATSADTTNSTASGAVSTDATSSTAAGGASANTASGGTTTTTHTEKSSDGTTTTTTTTTSSSSSSTSSTSSASSSTSSASSTSSSGSSSSGTLSCSSKLQGYFEEAAAKYNVDVNLLKAIAKAESNFNASATSSAGAMGIMQLMPSTARSLGISDAYNAYDNIMGGAKVISQHLKKYNGDVSLALAAYNAGSGNVDKYGGIPPFTETKNYVKKVLSYYNAA